AVADVDARRAHLHAHTAIDAIARGRVRGLAARLAPVAIVGDDERVLVEHHALEARVRAHVLADLLAHPPGVAVGGEAVEEHPERFPRPEAQSEHVLEELPDRGEVTDESEAGPERKRDPRAML